MTRGRCPAPAEVERVYWSTRDREPAERDLELHAHITACPDCTAQWTDIAGLVALGGKLEAPGAWERREELRTTLLSGGRVPPGERASGARPVRAWRWGMPAFAAAVAIALVVWRWPSGSERREPPRAAVLDHGSARHLVVSSPPDEIVRLVDGSVTITVAPLGPGERFRLITGDGEVDVAGAAFDVTARNDRLVSVRAIHGAVKVLVAGTHSTLQAGESWRATAELAGAPPDPAAPAGDAAIVAVVPPVSPVEPPIERPLPQIERAPRDLVPEVVPGEPPAASPAEPVGVDAAPAPAPAPLPRSMVQQAFDEGWAALRANDFATAAAAFERATAVTSDPRMIEDATFWRGVALAREGKVAVAAHVFTAFLSAYPSSARAHEVSVMLGWLLFERGDVADAKRRFEAGLQSMSREVRDSAQAGLRAVANRR